MIDYEFALRAATVVAARVQPADASVVPRTLRSILAKLDGHALIESVYVEEPRDERTVNEGTTSHLVLMLHCVRQQSFKWQNLAYLDLGLS